VVQLVADDNVTPIGKKPRKPRTHPAGTGLVPVPPTVDREALTDELRRAGQTWAQIAQAVGYGSRQEAHRARTLYLERAALDMSQEQRAEALSLEVDRLDNLQAAYWELAITGPGKSSDPDEPVLGPDIKAAEFVLKVIMSRAKLLGLEQAENAAQGPMTVVVTGNTDQYVAALKGLIERDEQDAVIVDED
jgi:hypothetical protein